MTFLLDLRELVRWIDSDAKLLSKDDLLDGARIRALSMIHKFLAYPHCDNFALLPGA